MVKFQDITINNKIGETSQFRIYTASKEDESFIVKVAKTFDDGNVLEREAAKFTSLNSQVEHIDTLADKTTELGSGYKLLLANINRSFMEPTQGDRRVIIISTPEISIDNLVPLPKLSNQTVIDARTSVWILGRIFKLYSLFELIKCINSDEATKYPLFSPGDYLISPEYHRVIYYNFSGEIEDSLATNFVKAITKFVRKWVDDESDTEYLNLLDSFITDGRDTFENAHKELYELVEGLWGIEYYPFTYKDKGTNYYKTIKELENHGK